MHEPQLPTQRQVIYVPPSPEAIEKYARDVCRELEKRRGKNYANPEVINGFAAFLKEAAKIYANYLTRKHNEGSAQAQ